MKCSRCNAKLPNDLERCNKCGWYISDEERTAGIEEDKKKERKKKKIRNRLIFWISLVIVIAVPFTIYHEQIINYVKTEQYKDDYAAFKINMAEKKEQKRIEKELDRERDLKLKEQKDIEQAKLREEERIAKAEERKIKKEEAAARKREEALAKKYKVGRRGEAGGVIFYDKGEYSDGWRYLECSVSNVGDTYWCVGSNQHDYIEGLRSGLGNGYYNTQKIIEEFGYETAAGIANSYDCGGFDDWYLPNRDEMKLCYKVLGKKYYKKAKKIPGWEPVRIGVLGIFTDPYNYWTSELAGSGSAYYVSCQGKFDGDALHTEMYSTDLIFGLVSNPHNLIRAIRRF